MAKGWYARERAAERIGALVGHGLDLVGFWDEVRDVLDPAVPCYLSPCWFTVDPASLLVTSHYDHGTIPEIPHDWLAQEYLTEDFNSLADFVRSPQVASSIHDATGGDPSKSERWKALIAPYGAEQELRVALRTRSGGTWGILALYREPGRPLFSEEEMAFLTDLSPHLAAGAQRALLSGEATDPDRPDAPGLVVLDDEWNVESITPGAEDWLKALGDGGSRSATPPPVLSVAAQALRSSGADQPGEIVFARVLTRDGHWLVLHGAAMTGGARPRVAVIIEPAHPARILPLLMAAYHLTEREQDIVHLVLRGNSTTEIAEQLFISAATVQQHLKSIFDKTGVRSRRELVGKAFFTHYEPRVRDNERRALERKPLRGGPAPAPTEN